MWSDRRRLGSGGQAEPQVGLVLHVTGRGATVLVPGGALVRLKLEAVGARAGDEVLLPEWLLARSPSPATRRVRAAAVAVCALVLAMVLSGFTMYLNPLPAVAMVSMDINPGVTLYVNSVMRVVSVQAVDCAGQALVEGLTPVHRPLGDVMEQLVDRAAQGLPAEAEERYLVIGASPILPGEVLSQQFLTALDRIQERALARLGAGLPTASVLHGVVIAVPRDVANDAKDLGLSAGEYALVLTAQETGTDVRASDVRMGDIMAVVKAAGLKPPDLLATAKQLSLEEAWTKHRDKVRADRQPAPDSPQGGTAGQQDAPEGAGGREPGSGGPGTGQGSGGPGTGTGGSGSVGTGGSKTGEPGGSQFPIIKGGGPQQRRERWEEVLDRLRLILGDKPTTPQHSRGGR